MEILQVSRLRRWLAILAGLGVAGCSAQGQVYTGPARPSSELATIESRIPFPYALDVFVDGAWVDDVKQSTVPPGNYKATVLAGLCHLDWVSWNGSFILSAGDTVRFHMLSDPGYDGNPSFHQPPMLVPYTNQHGETCQLPGFYFSVRNTNPLIDGARDGSLGEVREALASNAATNVRNVEGMTPLMLAAQGGYLPIVQALLSSNAEVDAQSTDGFTALMVASLARHPDIVRALLADKADANARSPGGITPLILGAGAGNAEVVRALLAAKADVNARTVSGGNPQWALVLVHERPEDNTTPTYGYTPLMIAAAAGRVEVVRVLLDARADMNAKTARGDTALSLAIRKKQHNVVDLLRLNGARE
ncbi:MAG TPA: ankyrin repeat domain-containing protein [Acetobacteraceae bacterium]|jgi:hypothetical protein